MPQLLPLIERDHNGVAEDEPGRRTAPNLIDRGEARHIAANIAKLPGPLQR